MLWKILECHVQCCVLLIPHTIKEKKKRICLQCGRPGSDPWVGKIPWRREQLPTPVLLPRESHGQRSWRATVYGAAESDTTERLELIYMSVPLRPAFYLCCTRSQEYINWSWFLLLIIPFPSRLLLVSLLFHGGFPKVQHWGTCPGGDSYTTLRTPMSTRRPRAPRVAHVVICLWGCADAQRHLIHHRSKAKLLIFLTVLPGLLWPLSSCVTSLFTRWTGLWLTMENTELSP